MRRRILIGIAACFYYSGLIALARWLTRRAGPRLVILNYHRATGGDLRRQWVYLRRHYRMLHAEAALEELFAARKNEPRRSDQRTSLVLTFDDGYRDNYTTGYALAQELFVPFTIYLIPAYLESGAHFWWLEGKRLVKRSQVKSVVFAECTYNLENAEDRNTLARYIDAKARFAQSVAEREAFLTEARQALAVPDTSIEEEMPALPLTWDEVYEMDKSGWVSFGAHTMHHPILACLNSAAEVKREIADCKTLLEAKLGHPVRTFAYPVGQMQHVNQEVVEQVRAAGFSWALTTQYGINGPGSAPYLLRRVEVDVDQHWLIVAAETAGLWGFFARLRWLPFVRKYFTNSAQATSFKHPR